MYGGCLLSHFSNQNRRISKFVNGVGGSSESFWRLSSALDPVVDDRCYRAIRSFGLKQKNSYKSIIQLLKKLTRKMIFHFSSPKVETWFRRHDRLDRLVSSMKFCCETGAKFSFFVLNLKTSLKIKITLCFRLLTLKSALDKAPILLIPWSKIPRRLENRSDFKANKQRIVYPSFSIINFRIQYAKSSASDVSVSVKNSCNLTHFVKRSEIHPGN